MYSYLQILDYTEKAFKGQTIQLICTITFKYQTKPKRLLREKHSSLFKWLLVNIRLGRKACIGKTLQCIVTCKYQLGVGRKASQGTNTLAYSYIFIYWTRLKKLGAEKTLSQILDKAEKVFKRQTLQLIRPGHQ